MCVYLFTYKPTSTVITFQGKSNYKFADILKTETLLSRIHHPPETHLTGAVGNEFESQTDSVRDFRYISRNSLIPNFISLILIIFQPYPFNIFSFLSINLSPSLYNSWWEGGKLMGLCIVPEFLTLETNKERMDLWWFNYLLET